MAYVITEKAATALTRLLRGDKLTGNTGVRGGPATISPDAFPAPFTVRWSAAEDNGSGAWVIWMPDAAQLLVYDGGAVTITGITAATELPAGWYTMDALQASSTTVYLVVTVVEATGVASAELSNTAGQATSGEKVYNLLVATMSTDSTTGAKRVKQFVDSAVVLGGGSSVTPDGVSTEFLPDPPSGTQPDGDEGRLQIKGFKAGAPGDTNTIADYLMGAANLPSNGMQILVRWTDSDGAHIAYLPIAELYQDSSGQTPTDLTVEFVADVDWYVNGSTHVLRKRLRVLNLRTGAVTDKANTTYANGWEIAANSIGISSIIGS